MLRFYRLLLGLVLLVVIVGASISARAQGDDEPLILDDSQTSYPLGLHLEYLEDPGGSLTIDEVTGPEFASRFIPSRAEIPNFGITNSVYWFRLYVRNETSDVSDWVLAFSNNRAGLVDLYIPSAGDSNWVHQQAGTYLPATVRKYPHPHIVFPLSFPTSTETTIYLRLQSNLPVRLSLSLWPLDLFDEYDHGLFGFLGFFYGAVTLIVLYNLLLYLFIRKTMYLYFSIFVAFYVIATASSDGTAQLYLFPNISFKYAIYGFGVLAPVFAVLFIRSFLELKQRLPWLNWLLVLLAVIQVLAFMVYATYPPGIALAAIIITAAILATSILALLGSILVWRQGLIGARYFLLGWLALLLVAIFQNSTNLVFIKDYPFFDVGQYIGTIALVIFLSLAIWDQWNLLRKQREQAESALIVSEERFRHLYERAPLGIIMVNPMGFIKQCNHALREMLGYEEQELINKHFVDFVYPDDRASADQNFQQLILDKQPYYEGEIRYLHKDGSPVWVTRSASTLRDSGGKIIQTFAMVRDIRIRKRQEAELRQYSEHLEELVAGRTRDLEVSRAKLSLLNRSSQTINMAGLDSEHEYIAVRAACAWLVAADAVAISLVDHEAGEVEDVYLMDRNQRLPGNRYVLPGSFVDKVLKEGISCRVDDIQAGSNGDQKGNWLGYFPDTRSGMAVVLRGSKASLGVLTVQSNTPRAYTADDQSILESFAAHVSITIENIRHYKQLEKSAVIEERQRLASDLHDSVTQLLYSIALMSGGWGLKASQDELADPAGHFHQIEELSLQALKELRMLIHQLRPPVLAEVGLLKALEDRLERVERRVEIQASIHIEGSLPRLTALVEEELYFMILEALNNSLRHARASSVQIDIHAHEKQLHIFVVDNGRGYDTSLPSKGMGTAILQNRAAAIGAKVTSHSQPGQGTRVDLLVGI